jgi:hypothetical protein
VAVVVLVLVVLWYVIVAVIMVVVVVVEIVVVIANSSLATLRRPSLSPDVLHAQSPRICYWTLLANVNYSGQA